MQESTGIYRRTVAGGKDYERAMRCDVGGRKDPFHRQRGIVTQAIAPEIHSRVAAVPQFDPIRRVSVAVAQRIDRKSTRLNSSHGYISYAVFCLKKKNNN